MTEEQSEANKIIQNVLSLHSNVNDVECAKTISVFIVDKIIDSFNSISSFVNPDIYESELDYWNNVKQIIESK